MNSSIVHEAAQAAQVPFELQDKCLAAAAALAGLQMQVAMTKGDLEAAREFMEQMYELVQERRRLRFGTQEGGGDV